MLELANAGEVGELLEVLMDAGDRGGESVGRATTPNLALLGWRRWASQPDVSTVRGEISSVMSPGGALASRLRFEF